MHSEVSNVNQIWRNQITGHSSSFSDREGSAKPFQFQQLIEDSCKIHDVQLVLFCRHTCLEDPSIWSLII
jgi:hypothetical protein